MSLKEQWDANRVKRQREVAERQQQVVEELQEFNATRAALHQHQREALSQFHQDLVAEVATLLEQLHQHRQDVAQEQNQQLAAHRAALHDYVWG